MKKIVMLSILAIVTVALSGCLESKKDPYAEILCGSKSIKADCIVTFYSDNHPSYLSQQQHQIGLSEPFIKISADEPTGKPECKLYGADFYIKKPVPNDIQPMICDSTYAKLLQTIITVGDIGWDNINSSSQTTIISGTEYKVATIAPSTQQLAKLGVDCVPWAQITLYGNTQNKLIDRITVKNPRSGVALSANVYNWRSIKELNKQVPSKIDIYKTDKWQLDLEKAVQIKYLDFSIEESEILPR